MEIKILLWVSTLSLFIVVPLLLYFGRNTGVSFWAAISALNHKTQFRKRIKTKYRILIFAFFILGIACYFVLLLARFTQP